MEVIQDYKKRLGIGDRVHVRVSDNGSIKSACRTIIIWDNRDIIGDNSDIIGDNSDIIVDKSDVTTIIFVRVRVCVCVVCVCVMTFGLRANVSVYVRGSSMRCLYFLKNTRLSLCFRFG